MWTGAFASITPIDITRLFYTVFLFVVVVFNAWLAVLLSERRIIHMWRVEEMISSFNFSPLS